jgi:hypothetical protein
LNYEDEVLAAAAFLPAAGMMSSPCHQDRLAAKQVLMNPA